MMKRETLLAFQKTLQEGSAHLQAQKKKLQEDARTQQTDAMTGLMSRILTSLISEKAVYLKGEKGEKGESIIGPPGHDGRDGKDGMHGRSIIGAKGDKGEKGDAGNVQELATLVLDALQRHEQSFDHSLIDPYLVGSVLLDDTHIGDKKVIMYDARKKKLVFEKIDVKGRLTGGASFASLANHPFTFTTLTANATISEGISLIDASSGNIIATLPLSSSGRTGRPFLLKRIDNSTHTVTIALSGTDTIEGMTTYQLASQYASIGIAPDGKSTYYIVL